jgi:excisionase family DNA binding protein
MNTNQSEQMKTTNTNNITAGERLLTPKELCERLKVSRVTGWKLTAERGLRCIKIGRSVRIRERDLEAWLEKHAAGGVAAEGGVA